VTRVSPTGSSLRWNSWLKKKNRFFFGMTGPPNVNPESLRELLASGVPDRLLIQVLAFQSDRRAY
jgi:hypothetical protein